MGAITGEDKAKIKEVNIFEWLLWATIQDHTLTSPTLCLPHVPCLNSSPSKAPINTLKARQQVWVTRSLLVLVSYAATFNKSNLFSSMLSSLTQVSRWVLTSPLKSMEPGPLP